MASSSEGVSAVYELLYNPNYIPRRSSNSHIDELTVDGKPSFVLIKEAEAEYYDVDPATNAIWQLIDGRRTVREIADEAKKFDETLTEKEVRDVVVSLAEEGTLESTEAEIQEKRVETPSAFELDVHLLKDSSKSLAGLFGVTRKLIRKEELPIALGIAALGFVLFYGTFLRIFANPSVFDIAGSTVLGFFFYQLFVLLPVYAVHELAHAAVCDYYGGKPRGIGTGLYYLAPFFYCDTSDAWRLSRRARIMISLAGPLSTLVISSLLVVWSEFVPPGFFQNILQIGAFFGYYGSLTNFSPVIETDGYYILADVLNIHNLRDEAFSFFKRGFLRILRRPVSAPRQSARRRRVIAVYSLFTFVWLVFFGYTTLWVMYIYGSAAYLAASGLVQTVLRTLAFNATSVGANAATLAYFALYLLGFVVMGAVSYKNIRMKGVRLETIHDKRVSAILPIPSSMERSKASGLVERAQRLARSHARSFSVTLEPPLCVAALKLGRVDQSLDAMRIDMQELEQSFRTLHSEFLSRNLGKALESKAAVRGNLIDLAAQFSASERKRAVASASQFLRKSDDEISYLLRSAFGTVWTLELSPTDYRRIKREIFPSLIAEDLGGADLPAELERFKVHEILGLDTVAQLASEVEEESKEVSGMPDVFQITALLEPIKSRLIFVGRTDRVEGSVVWLGGLYLYQAWVSYIGDAMEDSALGLKSLRLAHTASLTKTQAAKLQDRELEVLEKDLARFETLAQEMKDGMTKAESTYESARNFHETLGTLVSDEIFDVGLYKPILQANERHMAGVGDKFELFRDEFGKASRKLAADAEVVREERKRRVFEATPGKRKWSERIARVVGFSGRYRTPAFDSEVKFMFAVARLTYPVVIGSDIIV